MESQMIRPGHLTAHQTAREARLPAVSANGYSPASPQAMLVGMSVQGDPTPNAHLTYAPRPRMFREPWQRWAWAAVPLVSMSVFAFVPFTVAWRRGVVPVWVAATYFVGSATVFGFAVVQPNVNALFPTAVWAFMITAVVHVLRLDPFKPQSK
ncbi:hypothetical protein ACWD0Z_06120 [Streptomyces sp. NPDC003007]